MEDQRSVNSPRTLSFSKNRKAISSLPCHPFARNDNSTSGFGISGEHGPKLSEVYGFVGSISSVVATVIFLVWSCAPDSWLHSIGISYFPSRYWALAVPAYLMLTLVLAVGLYVGLNFMASPPPTCFNTIFDACSKDPARIIPSTDNDEQPIEPVSDIGINKINDIMFNNCKCSSSNASGSVELSTILLILDYVLAFLNEKHRPSSLVALLETKK